MSGYHTINLSSGVQLKADQKFSVILKLTNSKYNYPIAVESPISGYSSKAKANAGESFVSSDGNSWKDITTDSSYSNTNVCIKAFTDTGNISNVVDFLQPSPPEMYHLMLFSLTKVQDHQFHGIGILETEHTQQSRIQNTIIQKQEITQCRLQ